MSNCRTRAHSHRTYSRPPIDRNSVLAYLQAQQLPRTVALFQAESQQPNLSKLLHREGGSYDGTMQSLIMQIKEEQNERNVSEILIVEFLLHIWYCASGQQLRSDRINLLKEYMQEKGTQLAEIPELLPYFALPYLPQPAQHPVLGRIFTAEWRQDLQKRVSGLIKEAVPEQQWLNIIRDMSDICGQLVRSLSKESLEQHKPMLQRLQLYQNVIDSHSSSSSEQP